MINVSKGKIIFWVVFLCIVGLLIGDKGGGGYEKLYWACGGAILGVAIGFLFSKRIKKVETD
ncbi:hypothetical protein [Teredinibacter turnerae]|uniref:hypothetical protein n=1 Tax=Teredinibacter turnerae TaxID=2426 RepID=UPI0003F7D487|nr:hypothetical protein [Teredinibacter turnerae]